MSRPLPAREQLSSMLRVATFEYIYSISNSHEVITSLAGTLAPPPPPSTLPAFWFIPAVSLSLSLSRDAQSAPATRAVKIREGNMEDMCWLESRARCLAPSPCLFLKTPASYYFIPLLN